jgi:hypothetical protein
MNNNNPSMKKTTSPTATSSSAAAQMTLNSFRMFVSAGLRSDYYLQEKGNE